MKSYSQNNEQKHILEFFNGKKGTLLSIGENDGQTYSNAYALIQLGWCASLVEPSKKVFEKLQELHKENELVACLNFAIGNEDSVVEFWESDSHFVDKSDFSLLSSLKKEETEKWKAVNFKAKKVQSFTYETLGLNKYKFDFITIDAEGMDMEILKQIDLLDTQLLCIEWNSKNEIKEEILEYTSKFGMNKIIYQSGENLLIAR